MAAMVLPLVLRGQVLPVREVAVALRALIPLIQELRAQAVQAAAGQQRIAVPPQLAEPQILVAVAVAVVMGRPQQEQEVQAARA